ncbi:MAG: class E sortase [Patescibacteria group bacterium]|jgi:LPXTG-site transpeptidase (sortase) family protein|nr:class E sortase [Patescibacteria group bacterium]
MNNEFKPAENLIRQKISHIYNNQHEPNVQTEIKELQETTQKSKHQKFLNNLVHNQKDIVTIQTEWHNYYIHLSDNEKKQVWNEFYASNRNLKRPAGIDSFELNMTRQKNAIIGQNNFTNQSTKRSLTKNIHHKLSAGGKLTLKHHLESLLFGLGLAFLAIFIFMFGFFNEVLITPFIQPSSNQLAIPIIIGSSNQIASSTNEVIIPKINVQIPVNYSISTTNEGTIENFLEDGVVHYPTTVDPGQFGNAAFFGHSSNNIFNPGKYKFAFVLLHDLVPGDTFYLTYNRTLYVYKVISTKIVSPSDVSVLGPVLGQQATATLITCDPPGTSLNRLVVVGEQISPNISSNTQPSVIQNPITQTTHLPGNGPTLWDRFINSSIGKTILSILGIIIIIYIFRKISKNKTS